MSGFSESLDKTSLFLDLIAKRQEAISNNITYANAPGYVRQDVNFEQYLSTMMSGNPSSSLEGKLAQKLGPSPLMSQEGGEISTSQELMILQKNNLLYTLATRRISAVINELKTIAQLGK